MKKIDREYRPVLFYDTQCGVYHLLWSTAATSESAVWDVDGREYPLVKVETSSASHAFYIGKKQFRNLAGRAEQWRKREEKGKMTKGA